MPYTSPKKSFLNTLTTTPQTKLSQTSRWCVLPLSAMLWMGSAHAFEPFQADYSFNIAGLIKGSATRSLTQQGDIWTYNFKASVPLLANANEVSHFRYEGGKNAGANVVTLDHTYNFKYLNISKNSQFKVDWNNKTVSGSNQNGAHTYPAQVGALDMLDMEVQVREDIKHNQLHPSYLLADDKGIRAISFVNEGNEKITTPAGDFDTLRIRLVQDGNKRKTYFWLAPKLDYLPVRVRQDDGNLTYEINLTNYQSLAK